MFVRKREDLKNGTFLQKKMEKFKRAKSFKERYRIWDKSVAATVGAIFFLIIICLATYKTLEMENSAENCLKIVFKKLFSGDISYCNLKKPEVTCEGFENLQDVEKELERIQNETTLITELNLITEIETKIPKHSFNHLILNLQRLSLEGIGITEIEDEAFSLNFTKSISTLTITKTNVTYFNNILNGLSSLEMFFLTCPYRLETGTSNVEPNFVPTFLQPVHLTLNILQITSCVLSPNVIENLINTNVSLIKLRTIDFGYSRLESLNANSFVSTPNLMQLYLRGANLKHLEVGVFNKLSFISQIYLESNKLTYLREGIFSGIENNSNLKIYIHDNPWDCTCDLNWLKIEYDKNLYINKDNRTICKNTGEIFDDAIFCEETTTETISETTTNEVLETTSYTSTETSITTTTTNTIYFNNSDCSNSVDQKINIVRSDFDIIVCELHGINNATIEMKMKQYNVGTKLIWYDNNGSKREFNIDTCDGSIETVSAKFDTIYNICLDQDMNNISPSNCFAFKTREEYSERAWIINKSKNHTVIFLVIIIVVLIVLVVTATYWCVRLNPTLISGNERVVIIDRRVGVVPSDTTDSYSTPSWQSTLSSVGSTLGSISERSDITYINPMTISSEELYHWRELHLSAYPSRRHIFPRRENELM